jgi:surfactin synthase thioesterase subunit
VELLAVQYPARQDRLAEPPVCSVAELAERSAAALASLSDRPLALFGHSMGAVVAFEAARRLAGQTGAGPDVLFVSGRRAPGTGRPETIRPDDDDATMLRSIQALNGSDERVLTDPDLLPLILPAIRADYAALAAYRYAPAEPLGCPIVALVGDADSITTVEDARGWADHTTAGFELRVFPGGHFYLTDQHAEIATMITAGLSTPA